MFKNLHINKLIVLFLLAIAFISCDGRNRIHKTNAEVLNENNLLDSFSEKLVFIPEQPVQIITDTILSNGFQVKLNYSSLENDIILKTIKKENDTITKIHYKNFKAKLEVFKNGKAINKSTIDKNLFQEFENNDFWNKAIMQFIWIDYNTSTKNTLYLNTSFNIPDTDIYRDFILKIDNLGNIYIEEKYPSEKII
ncbi:DUF4738 domain-containing protein [Flaviramulus sp. BrNp1-15]|uniref:DUF4738 domain-containing protein n=1 Tax=Flaviramulus sp. BrNp1-15 TaxID=2916754 RepID=UPI001EE907D6|nr:DUF4738 domain-containing protein [Flaviramulus sp. BrNp1-15]ULC58116.1 DUF4738 domain-containing protein [Flaviramulus sp. BrNp1-15]